MCLSSKKNIKIKKFINKLLHKKKDSFFFFPFSLTKRKREEKGKKKKKKMIITKLHNKGSHLMIDAYDCDERLLSDVNHVTEFLKTLPKIIDMTIIMPPKVMDYKAAIPEDDGVTGFTVIAESHISIHTYPKRNFFAFDCFSCKEFDIKKAVKYIVNHFKVGHMVPQITTRGFDSREFNPDKVVRFDKNKKSEEIIKSYVKNI